jgi:hypothetical protein
MNKISDRLKDMPFMKRAMNANSTETQDDNNNNWFIDTGVGDICDELISKKNNNSNDNKTKKRCQEVVDSILHNSRIRMKKKEKKDPEQQQQEHTIKSKQNKEHKKHKHKK